jgi:sirohydrochlorin ferrochelatase
MADSDELEQMVMQLRRRILELEDIIFNHVEQNATSDYPHPFMRVQYLEFAPGLGIGSQLAGPTNGQVLTADNTIKGGLKWATGGGGGGGGSVPDATETVKGIARLATQAETDAGTNDATIVTPLKLANWSGRIIPDASETVKGIAELATQAETDAGLDDARIVTPKKLANWSGRIVPDATETVKGIAEIATQAETDTGTDDARIVTPLKLANWTGRVRKASFNIGNGSSTVIDVTHNFGTRDVVVQVYDNSTYETVTCLVTRPTTNTVRLTFISPPSTNQFRVLVIGL